MKVTRKRVGMLCRHKLKQEGERGLWEREYEGWEKYSKGMKKLTIRYVQHMKIAKRRVGITEAGSGEGGEIGLREHGYEGWEK